MSAPQEAALNAELAGELDRLRAAVDRLTDVHRIQNLMGRCAYLNEAGLFEEMLACFAQQTPGVTVQIGKRGVFEGLDGARRTLVETGRLFEEMHSAGMRRAYPGLEASPPRTGMQENQALSSPVIEVAADGRTAQGLWTGPCSQTQFDTARGEAVAFWVWIKFAVDFVKEDGGWKIWHYNLLPMFRTSYDQSWVESSQAPAAGPPFDAPGADRPASEFFNAYAISSVPRYLPVPPHPYETFDETFSY